MICLAMWTSELRAVRHNGTIFAGVVVVVEVVHLDGVGCVLAWSLLLVLDHCWSLLMNPVRRGHWICPQVGQRRQA